MARFIKKKKEQIGQPRGTFLFTGIRKMDNVLLRVIDFDTESLSEIKLDSINNAAKLKEKKTTTWLNIDGLHDQQVMQTVSEIFELDSSILEDVMNPGLRPKVMEFKNCVFIALKMLRMDNKDDEVIAEQLSFVITPTVLITFQEQKGDVFEPVRNRLRNGRKRIRSSGTDYLAYALLDIVVDNYIYIISLLGEKIELLEDKLLTDHDSKTLEEITNYKIEMNFFSRYIRPAKEMIMLLNKLETDFIKPTTFEFIKELQDNITQATDAADSYRDILSDQLNIYHTTVSIKLNDIMKVLTIFAAIFIPLTFIAGVYGTNFEVLPELHFKYSYFIMLGVMLLVAVFMLLFFRRKKWL